MTALLIFVFGLIFGLTLSRSGASDYNYIQGMFLFTEFQLYGIIASAVIVLAPALFLLKKYGKTANGEQLKIAAKPGHKGNIVGGILFGIGWSITGMCPGPILVNIGEGKIYAIAALLGAVSGTYLFGRFYAFLQKRFNLPSEEEGTGCG